MSDPTRILVSQDATDLEKELLASWGDERPTAASRDKTLAALGIATTTVAATASIAPKAAVTGWTLLGKWLGVSALALGAAVAGVVVVSHQRDTKPSAPPVATVAPARVAETAAPVETVHAPVAPATIELPEPVQHHASPAKVVAPPAASTLAEQVAALDRARTALDSGDAARARHLVDAYESEYPGGAFTQEAEVVRIDALAREGNRAEAERAGKRFLAAYPKSPHAARVRTLLGYDP